MVKCIYLVQIKQLTLNTSIVHIFAQIVVLNCAFYLAVCSGLSELPLLMSLWSMY